MLVFTINVLFPIGILIMPENSDYDCAIAGSKQILLRIYNALFYSLIIIVQLVLILDYCICFNPNYRFRKLYATDLGSWSDL